MPRVVPSDVVAAIDLMFRDHLNPSVAPYVGYSRVPEALAVVRLVESVPPELLVLDPRRYARLVASVGYLRALPDVFQSARSHHTQQLQLSGFPENVIWMIREAMSACPDETSSADTASLVFIPEDLRESIRLDISAANRDLASGGWKGATVLAGSAVEALLLWALQQRSEADITRARGAVTREGRPERLTRDPGPDLERWLLPDYVEVAGELGILKPESVQQARLAKNFRNLIHPGRAFRLGQKCDRGTALSALAAVELAVRDLTDTFASRDRK